MLLAGDEFGHSQNGNDNAYAQDNETTWLNWLNITPQGLSAEDSTTGRLRQGMGSIGEVMETPLPLKSASALLPLWAYSHGRRRAREAWRSDHRSYDT
jgi:pullulanase/glycogen debranching enzyme